MSIYVIKLKTPASAGQTVTDIEKLGYKIISIDIGYKTTPAGTVVPRTKDHVRAVAHLHTEEAKVKAAEAHRAQAEAERKAVVSALRFILVANPFAPMERIVKEFNATGSRSARGNLWTVDTIKRYVDTALEELTAPLLPLEIGDGPHHERRRAEAVPAAVEE